MSKSSSPPVWLLMLLVCFPQLSETIYTPSLPEVAKDFAITNNLAQWTLSIYFIGFALGVIFWGNYSDHIGRRQAILRGIAIYFLATLSCFFCTSIGYLFIFRTIQAFGISVGSVIVQSISREVYEGKKRNQIFSLLTISMTFSPAIGPFMGGFIANWFGWRSNFTLLCLLISIVYLLALIFLKETHKQLDRKNTWYDHVKTNIHILSHRKIVTFAILVALLNGIMFSYYSHAPFIFTNLLNLSLVEYGALGLLSALGILIGSLCSIKLSKKWTSEKIILLGCCGCFCSIVLLNIFLLFGYKTYGICFDIVIIKVPMLLFFLFLSLTIPSLLGTALQDFKSHIGGASSIFGFTYYVFTAFFNFIMGVLDDKTITRMPLYFLCLASLILLIFLHYRLSTPHISSNEA